jgi:hypothetical protein
MAQPLVIVQILVAQRQAKYPLPDQRAHRVLDPIRGALIHNARRQPIHEPDRRIGTPQQQRPPGRCILLWEKSGLGRGQPYRPIGVLRIEKVWCAESDIDPVYSAPVAGAMPLEGRR